MAVAGRFCVIGILVLKLQTVLTNPTCICNEKNTNRILTLQNVGTNQAQNIIRQNLGPSIANQIRFGQNLGQPLGQNNVASSASALQQQSVLQSLTQQLSNSAPITVSNTAPSSPTITLLDPATTAAFKSFLTSKSGTNGDQTVNYPGQTRLPLSSLPVSFINKCQSTPEVIAVQNQQRGLSNAHSQGNLAPTQNSLTPLQGQVSLQSLLNVLTNLQNQQATSVVTENLVPANRNQQHNIMSQNAVPAVFNSPIPNQPQNMVTSQNIGPAVYNSPDPNQLQNQMVNQNLVSAVFNSPVSNLQQNPVGIQNTVPAPFNNPVQNPQQNPMANQNAEPAVFNCPFSNQQQTIVPYPNPGPAVYNNPALNQQQNIVQNQNGAQTLLPNSPAPIPYAGQSFVPALQSQPQPLVQSQPTLPTNMLHAQGHIMPGQQYTTTPPSQPSTESPIQAANSNLKKLLPLLFDLVKENECGGQNCNCPCNNNFNNNNNNYAMQPHVNSGYASQISYGHTDKSEMGENDNEVYESLGSLRDRLKLWKAKTDSSAEKEGTEQSCDTDVKDE